MTTTTFADSDSVPLRFTALPDAGGSAGRSWNAECIRCSHSFAQDPIAMPERFRVGRTVAAAFPTSHRAWVWIAAGMVLAAFSLQVPAQTSIAGATRIASGAEHSCAITALGGVECWGRNSTGQLGDGSTTERRLATPVSGLASGVSAIAAGANHSCALNSVGTVKCWGNNNSGQLGNGGGPGNQTTPVEVSGLTGVTAIAVGGRHSCALTGGTLKCWGSNAWGQLGNGEFLTSEPIPVDVLGISGVAAVTAGEDHTCARTSAGAALCWGFNVYGQLGDDSTNASFQPIDVGGLASGVTAIAAGASHTCAVVAGAVRCWGNNEFGAIGDGSTTQRLLPTPVSGLSGIATIVGGTFHTCALSNSGGARCWGRNHEGQLGDGTTGRELTPVNVTDLSSGVSAIAAGGRHSCALDTAGAVKCWGWNFNGQIGDGKSRNNRVTPVAVTALSSAAVNRVAAGADYSCALTTTGAVKCWGWNENGQLGDGSNENRLAAVDAVGLSSGNTAIATGSSHTCALATGGAARCWGSNAFGQLGNGNRAEQLAPAAVISLSAGVQGIAAGINHTCAVTSGGAAQCWGQNGFFQLGDGTDFDRLTPTTAVGLGSGVTAVAAGLYHSCALVSGGVWCWGVNSSGQVGGGGEETSVPVAVFFVDPVSVVAIAAGLYHSCALTSGGAVKCWGENGSGQIGNGSTIDVGSPTDVVGLASGVIRIAAGYDHTCALTSGGSVKCWGRNGAGQLGDGSSTSRLTPVDVIGISGATSIAAGSAHTCAVLGTGSARCWGYNIAGQVGDGTAGYVTRPTNARRLDPAFIFDTGFELDE